MRSSQYFQCRTLHKTSANGETGVLLTKHGDKAADLEKLLSAVPTEKLHAVLKKLNALEGGKCGEFISDAVKVDGRISPAGNLLVNNLDKIDDGIIEAWKLLVESPVIRLDINNLNNLSKILKIEVYKNLGKIDGLKIAIKKSPEKEKFIELLSNARIKPGTNGKYVVIGTDMAKRVGPFARDIKAMVGENIELFNEAYQKNNKFVIDGVERTWDEIIDQWKDICKEFPPNGIVPYEHFDKIKSSYIYTTERLKNKKGLLPDGFTPML